MKEKEMKQIANWIATATKNANDDQALLNIQQEVEELMVKFQSADVLSSW